MLMWFYLFIAILWAVHFVRFIFGTYVPDGITIGVAFFITISYFVVAAIKEYTKGRE